MGKSGVVVGCAVAACLALLLSLAVLAGSDEAALTGSGLAGVVCAPGQAASGAPAASVEGLSPSQMANAAAIVATGTELGVPQRAKVIAIATAMQESNLRMYANAGNPESLALPHEAVGKDHDSVGLFQQRASWGSTAVRMNANASAKLFYQRLLAIPGWASMPLTRAAQRVQASAFPDAYARWEAKANQIVGAVLGIICPPGAAPGQTVPASPLAQVAIDRALSQVGVPYAWGGGNASGPTRGISDGGGPADRAGDSGKTGFDCSGLMVYAFAPLGVTVPHQTKAIWATFQPPITDRAQIQPGDMIMLSSNGQPSGINHVGLYLGDGRVVHAPESGTTVRVEENIWQKPLWTKNFVGALRPQPAPHTNPA